MLLIDFTVFIQQCIPIHWRSTYREYLCQVLLSPLVSVYQQWMKYRKHIHDQPTSFLQVGVLEYYLNVYYAHIGYNYIEIIDTNTPGSFQMAIKTPFEDKKKEITAFVQSKIPVGTRCAIIVSA